MYETKWRLNTRCEIDRIVRHSIDTFTFDINIYSYVCACLFFSIAVAVVCCLLLFYGLIQRVLIFCWCDGGFNGDDDDGDGGGDDSGGSDGSNKQPQRSNVGIVYSTVFVYACIQKSQLLNALHISVEIWLFE